MCSRSNMSLDNPEMTPAYAPSNVHWKDVMYKAAITAGIAGAAALFLAPEGTVSVAGVSLPQFAAVGLGAATGSIAGDLAHNYVLPHIPQSQKYLGIESAAVSVGAAIAGAYIGMGAIGDATPLTPIVLGGGSYMVADYVVRNFIDIGAGSYMAY